MSRVLVCFCCLFGMLTVALVLYYFVLRQRRTMTDKSKGEVCNKTTTPSASPGGVISLVALFPAQKWDTIQNFMAWKNEMSALDRIIEVVEPNKSTEATTSEKKTVPFVAATTGPILTAEEEALIASAMKTSLVDQTEEPVTAASEVPNTVPVVIAPDTVDPVSP